MMRALTSTAASLEDRALLKKCIVAEKFKLSAIAFFLPQSMNQLKQQSKKSSCLKVVNLLLLQQDPPASGKASGLSKPNESDPNHQLDVSDNQVDSYQIFVNRF
jgi:hypothetical protein